MENEVVKKRCNACLEEKEVCNFHRDKYRPDGLVGKCKKCQLEKRPSLKYNPIGETKICQVCLEIKDLCEFNKRSDRTYLYTSRCIKCKKEGKIIDKKVFLNNQKKCPSCNVYKNYEDYGKCDSCKNGIVSYCKICTAIKKKEYNDAIDPNIKRDRKRKSYLKNKDNYIIRYKEYQEANKEKYTLWRRDYEKNIKYTKPLTHLTRNIRSLIKVSFRRSFLKESKSTSAILCCSWEDFKHHIESQFLPWMSWDNYGNVCESLEYDCSWDLDHIIPVSLATTEEEVYLLNHWSNFQPLCSFKNRRIKKNIVSDVTNLELNITVIGDTIYNKKLQDKNK